MRSFNSFLILFHKLNDDVIHNCTLSFCIMTVQKLMSFEQIVTMIMLMISKLSIDFSQMN